MKKWLIGLCACALLVGGFGLLQWQRANHASALFDRAFLHSDCGGHTCKDLRETNGYMGVRLHEERTERLITIGSWCAAALFLVAAAVGLLVLQRKQPLDE